MGRPRMARPFRSRRWGWRPYRRGYGGGYGYGGYGGGYGYGGYGYRRWYRRRPLVSFGGVLLFLILLFVIVSLL